MFTDDDIVAARPPKVPRDPHRPYAFHVEPEYQATGRVDNVATVFLTNRECPFRCLFCDLWKNTTDETVPIGAIPGQIDYALSRLPPVRHVKLYNSGNFFDPQAIPVEDYRAIADRLHGLETVIVENHPKLCGDRCLRFRDLLSSQLEIALGLETAHAETLARLNKRMTVADFQRAVAFLTGHGVRVRAFILLRPPFMSPQQGQAWAIRSVQLAYDAGVECCVIIPTRAGNGIMERLQNRGEFGPPSLRSLEQVFDEGLRQRRGRLFVDLWDIDKLEACPECGPARRERLRRMNLTQEILPRVECSCNAAAMRSATEPG